MTNAATDTGSYFDPSVNEESLSGAFIYGLHWDGHCLARGQLTRKALWKMRKLSRKHSEKRIIKLAELKSPAMGGFELMMQASGNPAFTQKYTPMVLKAWSDFFTYSKKFSYIKSHLFQSGVHLIIIAWYSQQMSFQMKTVVVPYPRVLSIDQLEVISKEFMRQQCEQGSNKLPKDYLLAEA